MVLIWAFALLSTLCVTFAEDKVSYCPNSCFSGSCCEVQSNEFLCCPYENGVCCGDGKHCCPQGSSCNLKLGTCSYNFEGSYLGQTLENSKPFAMMELKQQVVEPYLKKTASDQFVICPDRESTCGDAMTCCKMKNDTYGCCRFDKGVCCSDGLHCCPQDSVCDLTHGTCSSRTESSPNAPESLLRVISSPSLASSRRKDHSSDSTRLMAYESVMCPNSSFECPSQSTCCLAKSDHWACCPMPGAVCCSDGAHCCPKHYTCHPETQECILENHLNASVSKLDELVPSLAHSIQCPNAEWECPKDTTCCQLRDNTWGCCNSPGAVCCSDGLHCCPANSVCDLEHASCILPSGQGVPAISHTLSQVSPTDQVCPGAESICRNGTCCKTPTGNYACCPHVEGVCCSDMEHCCPKGYQCGTSTSSCLPLAEIDDDDDDNVVDKKPESQPLQKWFKKRPALKQIIANLSQVCPGGQFSCESETTCCQLADKEWACCPLPNAVCCSDHEHCCPEGTQCDVVHEACLPHLASTQPPVVEPRPSSQLTNLCPDHESVCEDKQTCCTLPDQSWACCPLDQGVCCSDHLHCCPKNTMCLPDSSGCVSQSPNTTVKPQPRFETATPMTRSPSSKFQSLPADLDQPDQLASWCGVCGDQGCCSYPDQGRTVIMCCPHVDGTCCSDGKSCCPRHSKCLPDGRCELASNVIPDSFAPFLVPSTRSGLWAAPNVAVAPPADWDVLLDFVRYRHLRQVHHTICPDNLHFCDAHQKCCPSRQHGFTCIPDTATCCSDRLNTYCPPPKSCSLDGRSCL